METAFYVFQCDVVFIVATGSRACRCEQSFSREERAMQVRDVMTRDVTCCTKDTSLADVARMMQDCNCGLIPVVDSNSSKKPIGVLTDRDIVLRTLADGQDPFEMAAGDIMTQPVITISADADMQEGAQKMQHYRIRRLVVMDRNGQCCGMIAQADLARSTPPQQTGQVVKEVSQPTEMASAR